MNRKKLLLILTASTLVLFMGLLPLYGGDAARTGTAGGVQVQVPVGGRSLAMAGANVAEVKGLEALYWNPAGLGTFQYKAAGTFSTMKIFNDVNVNYLGLGFNMGRLGALGFQLKAFDFGEIPVTTTQDMDGLSGQTFSPTFVTTGLTYSKRLTDAISVGFTGKLVMESIPRASASAVAFDMGIQYIGLGGIENVSLGVVVKNIGTKMKYTGSAFLGQSQDAGSPITDFREIPTASANLPATVELGLGYHYTIAKDNSLLFLFNFQNENYGEDAYKFGVEYGYSDFIALRAGYIAQGIDSEDQLYSFAAGIGLQTTVSSTTLIFDYAYRNSQYFNGNNLFSLTIGF
jgi:hypothetical protein